MAIIKFNRATNSPSSSSNVGGGSGMTMSDISRQFLPATAEGDGYVVARKVTFVDSIVLVSEDKSKSVSLYCDNDGRLCVTGDIKFLISQ